MKTERSLGEIDADIRLIRAGKTREAGSRIGRSGWMHNCISREPQVAWQICFVRTHAICRSPRARPSERRSPSVGIVWSAPWELRTQRSGATSPEPTSWSESTRHIASKRRSVIEGFPAIQHSIACAHRCGDPAIRVVDDAVIRCQEPLIVLPQPSARSGPVRSARRCRAAEAASSAKTRTITRILVSPERVERVFPR